MMTRQRKRFFKDFTDLSVVDEETVKIVAERHRGVEGLTDGLLGALVHWQGLEAVGVNAGPSPQVLVLNEL